MPFGRNEVRGYPRISRHQVLMMVLANRSHTTSCASLHLAELPPQNRYGTSPFGGLSSGSVNDRLCRVVLSLHKMQFADPIDLKADNSSSSPGDVVDLRGVDEPGLIRSEQSAISNHRSFSWNRGPLSR